MDSRETAGLGNLLQYNRNCLNVLTFLKRISKIYMSKSLAIVNGGHDIGGLLRNLDWNTGVRGSSDASGRGQWYYIIS